MSTSVLSRHINYDEVASIYNQRYAAGGPEGIAVALHDLVSEVGAGRILEVGCGTGHWMAALQPIDHMYGLDLSFGMLQKARERQKAFYLVQGNANQLPFPDKAFDVVFCVHALHHFDRPQGFVRDARRVLRQGGALAVIGMNPHAGRERWYLYDYFPGTYETDLARYPSAGTIMDWMVTAGFDSVRWRVAARIMDTRIGQEVLADPILQKHGTSQLALLTDEAYAAGMARIKEAIANAEAAGETLVFPVDISIGMVSGYLQER